MEAGIRVSLYERRLKQNHTLVRQINRVKFGGKIADKHHRT
jgi:hypothetical protein